MLKRLRTLLLKHRIANLGDRILDAHDRIAANQALLQELQARQTQLRAELNTAHTANPTRVTSAFH